MSERCKICAYKSRPCFDIVGSCTMPNMDRFRYDTTHGALLTFHFLIMNSQTKICLKEN
jgi:hypothetical protein